MLLLFSLVYDWTEAHPATLIKNVFTLLFLSGLLRFLLFNLLLNYFFVAHFFHLDFHLFFLLFSFFLLHLLLKDVCVRHFLPLDSLLILCTHEHVIAFLQELGDFYAALEALRTAATSSRATSAQRSELLLLPSLHLGIAAANLDEILV